MKKAHEKFAKTVKKKKNARSVVYHAKKRGDLVKPDKCPECDREIDIQAHHEDYDKPLEIMWLCTICHAEKHLPSATTKMDW